LLAALCLSIFAGCSTLNHHPGNANITPGSETSPRTYKKLALLVGIDDYLKMTNLKGCVNDVLDMKRLLTDNFGFNEKDILVLTNKKATHKGIVDAFRTHLIDKATANTIVVFHYCGHGSQMRDQKGGDEEFDHMDETIVPHDSRTPGKFDIRDDQLNGLFTQLVKKTKNVTFILDSCHSGSGIRGTGVPRQVPPDPREPPPAASWEISTRGSANKDSRFENLNYVLISGCRAKERSFELKLGGIRRGALTYYLVKEIRDSHKKGVTYQDVMDQVKANVNRENHRQHPQIEGSLINNYVFSDKTSVPHPYVLVSPEGDNLLLDAGLVHGVTRGSKYDVYKPKTKHFDDPDKAIARIEVTKVQAFKSTAKIIKFIKGKKPGDILQASRAIEVEHAYEIETFPIYLNKQEDSKALKKIREKIGTIPHYTIVKNENEARLILAEVLGKIKIYKSSGQEIVDTGISTSDPDFDKKVMEQIEHWAKWYNVLSVENRKSQDLRVKLEVKGVTQQGKRGGDENRRIPTQQFNNNEEIQFIVKNIGRKKFYFVILNISGNGSIDVVYPESGDGEALLPGKSVVLKGMETFVPGNYQRVTDIIKVIAAGEQVNFNFLEMNAASASKLPLRRKENPLTSLLKQAALQTAYKDARKKKPGDWDTTMSVFDVVRKEEK
jgi:hypothetical protein